MAAIRLVNVQKSYGDHPPVIRRVNLDIAQHEFAFFWGRRVAASRPCFE